MGQFPAGHKGSFGGRLPSWAGQPGAGTPSDKATTMELEEREQLEELEEKEGEEELEVREE